MRLPDPALVVLVGASGAGKSTWAASHYLPDEVVSSDALRAVVGSSRHDLDASTDAFAVLEQVVEARVGRRLATVVDTLGFDAARRQRWRDLARAAGLPSVAVVLAADDATCRRRNAERDVPVPAKALAGQLKRMRTITDELAAEGWEVVVVADAEPAHPPTPIAAPPVRQAGDRRTSTGVEVVLQVSRFPWGEDPARWLTDVATAADALGFAGIALMDHLVQIPQVGRAWEPIPEPYVTLGLLAGLDTGLRLGTLVTPLTLRPAGVVAKAVATLDALSGGRAFVGVGAGWWAREHAGFGVPFPSTKERLDRLEDGIEVMRALWAPGTKAWTGTWTTLPETTCYPRPTGPVPVVVGGGGERRTLRIAARLGDACNVRSDAVAAKTAVLRRHCAEVGRDPAEVAVTVLDVSIIGSDRADVARRVERLRGRVRGETAIGQRERHAALADLGVATVFLALPDLAGADDLERVAPLLA